MFFDRVDASRDAEAFRFLIGSQWVSVTWGDTEARVTTLAAGLLALGIAPEQRVGIASSTRYEWILADLAIACAGAATTTVYATTTAEDTAYIIGDSACRMVFAENDEQLTKLAEHRHELPAVRKVISFDGAADGDWVITLDELAELGEKFLVDHPRCVRDAVDAITPDRLASLIYTSGTTGRPKGVRLRHGAWVHQGAAVAALNVVGEDDLQLLWLPLAHSFGKVLLAAQLACGFVSAIDGRIEKTVDDCSVRPTFMAAVPRLFEKAQARMITMAEGGSRLPRALFDRAFTVAADVRRRRLAGRPVRLMQRLQLRILDRLMFVKVRNAFGGRIRFFVSGSAPLNRDIGEWFNDAGMVILEGYGLTETAGGASINTPEQCRLGSVGHAFAGTRVRIADDGFLTITGRLKDMFKTSGGKYIVPSAIEAKFVAQFP
ncbi:AMP-dependent synthetase/ligase [Mycolicibacterium lacusdiani]|uniref:AMP-dependent synthetase/ligase n=1 Tax=Mycolicibacterium lacusdiani TaxID=2895283 RepID=UPI003FD8B502